MNGTFGKGCVFNCTAKCPNGEFCNRIDGSCPEGPMESRFELLSIPINLYFNFEIRAFHAFKFNIIWYSFKKIALKMPMFKDFKRHSVQWESCKIF